MVGHKVSHSNIKTKKRQKPNLQCVKVIVDGTTRRMRVCTRWHTLRQGRQGPLTSHVPPRLMPADDAIVQYVVPKSYAGLRADVFLRERLKKISRTRVRSIIESGTCWFKSGRQLSPSSRVDEGRDHLHAPRGEGGAAGARDLRRDPRGRPHPRRRQAGGLPAAPRPRGTSRATS